jgi:hypothetical protein
MSQKTDSDRASLCTFTFADGRQCRMLWRDKRSKLCLFHQQQANRTEAIMQAGETITSCLTTDFVSSCTLNAALSRIFFFSARGDFDLKTARTLAYLAQIISKNIPAAKQELRLSVGLDQTDRILEFCLGRVNEQFCRPSRQPAPPQPKPQPAPADAHRPQ